MPYDIDLTRAILHKFGTRPDTGEYIQTDGMTFSSPNIVGFDEEQILRHVERLIEIGLLRRTHEIRMKYHPDPRLPSPPDPAVDLGTAPGQLMARHSAPDEPPSRVCFR